MEQERIKFVKWKYVGALTRGLNVDRVLYMESVFCSKENSDSMAIVGIPKELKDKLDYSFFNPGGIEKKTILEGLKRVERYASGLLLDIGCGERPYQGVFSGVTQYIGLDLVSRGKGPNVRGDATALPFKSEVFDAVLATQVLEHLPEPKKMIEEGHRVLKKGGHLIMTAPMTWWLHEIPHDYYRFTKYGLEYLTKSVGFKVIAILDREGAWSVIGQKLSYAIFYNPRAPKNKLSSLLKRVVCALIQITFSGIDRVLKNKKETLGYILVAEK